MSVKPLLRVAVVVAGACIIPLILAVGASADVVDPSTPYKPRPVRIDSTSAEQVPTVPVVRVAPANPRTIGPQPADSIGERQPADAAAAPAMQEAAASEPAIVQTAATPAPADPAMTPRPVPASESIVTRPSSRAPVVAAITTEPITPFETVERSRPTAFPQVRAFLAELVSVCKVGAQAGTGGPVLVLAVLGMAAALNRRWVFAARSTADEEPPDFLYAWDVIAPG